MRKDPVGRFGRGDRMPQESLSALITASFTRDRMAALYSARV